MNHNKNDAMFNYGMKITIYSEKKRPWRPLSKSCIASKKSGKCAYWTWKLCTSKTKTSVSGCN